MSVALDPVATSGAIIDAYRRYLRSLLAPRDTQGRVMIAYCLRS